jgi:CRP/FNR family cyclic AMP-dependent transcriptional regulator
MTVTARAVLRSNRLLRDLPDGALDLLAALAIRRSVGRGARIFAEGDPGDSLLGIIAGQVRISASTPDGREIFLNILEPGDSLGEIAVLDGEPRTATADALTDVELFVIRRPDLLALISREPRLAMHLIALLCRRLRWTSELIEEAAFLPAGARLASRLLKLGAEHGRPADGGITLHISQAELAAFLNVSRQVVNQQLQAWRRQGWVALGRGRVVILDPEGLRSAARGGG